MKKITALIAGLAVSPLIPAFLSSVNMSRMPNGGFDLISIAGWIPISYAFSVLAEFLFGFPIFIVLWKFNLIRWWSAILGGLFSAICFSVIIRFPNIINVRDVFVPSNMMMGGASAFCFWLFWRLGSEDEISRKSTPLCGP